MLWMMMTESIGHLQSELQDYTQQSTALHFSHRKGQRKLIHTSRITYCKQCYGNQRTRARYIHVLKQSPEQQTQRAQSFYQIKQSNVAELQIIVFVDHLSLHNSASNRSITSKFSSQVDKNNVPSTTLLKDVNSGKINPNLMLISTASTNISTAPPSL